MRRFYSRLYYGCIFPCWIALVNGRSIRLCTSMLYATLVYWCFFNDYCLLSNIRSEIEKQNPTWRQVDTQHLATTIINLPNRYET